MTFESIAFGVLLLAGGFLIAGMGINYWVEAVIEQRKQTGRTTIDRMSK